MLTKCSGLLCYSIILEQYFLFSATEDDDYKAGCEDGVLRIVWNQRHARGKPWTPKEDDAMRGLRSRFGDNR